mgnify:CR=1 FL=1
MHFALRMATKGRPVNTPDRDVIKPQQVQQALDACEADGFQSVPLESGWELRVRTSDMVIPIELQLRDERVCIFNYVITPLPEGDALAALTDQALRFNRELRHVRLATSNEALVAETCLHGGQLDASWLRTSARAVAVAWRHTSSRLQLLASDPEIARLYREIVSDPQP